MSADVAALDVGGVTPVRLDGDVSAVLIRQLAECAPAVMVVAVTPDFRIVYANKAAHRAASSAPGDLVGRIAPAVFGFADPDLLATTSQAQAHAVADRTDGVTTWWDVTYTALDTASPGASTVLISAVDVTHHQTAQAEAQAAQHTLDALLAYIPEGISISRGPEIRVERVSARGMALIGRNADELTGQSALQQTEIWEVYRPGSDLPLPPADRPLARATRTGEVTLNEALMVRRPDGSLLTVLCNSGPIRDPAGRVTGAAMAWHDVGELQRAQAAMRDSEERLRAVLVQVPAAIFIVDAPDGHVTFKSRLVDEVLVTPTKILTGRRPRFAVGRCIRTARPTTCPSIRAGGRCFAAKRCAPNQ